MSSKLLIIGAGGRMGKRILRLAAQNENFSIIGAVERENHPDTGKDAGSVAGLEPLGLQITTESAPGAEVVIDFSLPEAAEKSVQYVLENSAALVIGTTGLKENQKKMIDDASKKIPIIYGTNMSVGMNVLFATVPKVAEMLGEDYDIEIIEQHHNQKKDAPSGTALTLAEKVCKQTKRDFPASLVHGREGKNNLRKKGNIGIHAVRAGDITGIHQVIFATLGETVTIEHTARTKTTFAQGALRAAQWLIGKKPGAYSMAQVLGIENKQGDS